MLGSEGGKPRGTRLEGDGPPGGKPRGAMSAPVVGGLMEKVLVPGVAVRGGLAGVPVIREVMVGGGPGERVPL